MFDQALDDLDSFDQSNGLLIHLNQGPIKHEVSNVNFNGPKLGFKIANFILGPRQIQLNSNNEGLTILQDTICSQNILKELRPI